MPARGMPVPELAAVELESTAAYCSRASQRPSTASLACSMHSIWADSPAAAPRRSPDTRSRFVRRESAAFA